MYKSMYEVRDHHRIPLSKTLVQTEYFVNTSSACFNARGLFFETKTLVRRAKTLEKVRMLGLESVMQGAKITTDP